MGRKKRPSSQTRTSFFLPAEIKLGLEMLKERDGVPESESARRALRAYLTEKRIDFEPKAAKEQK